MKENYRVLPISYQDTKSWLRKRHYAQRMPQIIHSYGLFYGNDLSGVITYGHPANCSSNQILKNISFEILNTLELNRLCLLNNKKNESSFLISQSLKMLPSPICIISYADPNNGHIGYVYQATNFIYTGLSQVSDVYCKDGNVMHSKSFSDLYGTRRKSFAEDNGYKIIKKKPKHRYIYFLGTKKQKKEVLSALQYPILPYPKGESIRYKVPEKQERQLLLFST